MTWIVAGLTAASAVYKGVRASGTNLAPARSAAEQVKQDKLDMLAEKKTSALDAANLGMDVSETQYQTGVADIGTGTSMQTRDVTQSGDIAMSQSGLATSGTIEQKVATQTGDILNKYKSDMQKLVDTRAFAGKERDLQLTEADLAYRSGEMSAEEAYQNTLTGIEQTPDTFLEGMFS